MRSLGTKDVHVVRGVEDGKAYCARAEQCGDGEGPHADSASACRAGRRLSEGVGGDAGDPAGPEVQRRHSRRPPGGHTGRDTKTGSFTKVYHDVGIVEPPSGKKPFVLVVLTRGIEKEPLAHQLVAEIARHVFEHATASNCRRSDGSIPRSVMNCVRTRPCPGSSDQPVCVTRIKKEARTVATDRRFSLRRTA